MRETREIREFITKGTLTIDYNGQRYGAYTKAKINDNEIMETVG